MRNLNYAPGSYTPQPSPNGRGGWRAIFTGVYQFRLFHVSCFELFKGSSGADPIAILTITTAIISVNTENKMGRNFREPGVSLLKKYSRFGSKLKLAFC